MATIQYLEVRFDVDGDEEEAVFASLFDKYIAAGTARCEEERARCRLIERERRSR